MAVFFCYAVMFVKSCRTLILTLKAENECLYYGAVCMTVYWSYDFWSPLGQVYIFITCQLL